MAISPYRHIAAVKKLEGSHLLTTDLGFSMDCDENSVLIMSACCGVFLDERRAFTELYCAACGKKSKLTGTVGESSFYWDNVATLLTMLTPYLGRPLEAIVVRSELEDDLSLFYESVVSRGDD